MAKKKPVESPEKVEAKVPAETPAAEPQKHDPESDLAKHPKFDKFKSHGGHE